MRSSARTKSGAWSRVVFDINVYALDFMHGTTVQVAKDFRRWKRARVGRCGWCRSRTDADADVVGADLMEQSWALQGSSLHNVDGMAGTPQASATPLSSTTWRRSHLAYYRSHPQDGWPIEGAGRSLHPGGVRWWTCRARMSPAGKPSTLLLRSSRQEGCRCWQGAVMLSSANRFIDRGRPIRKELEGALSIMNSPQRDWLELRSPTQSEMSRSTSYCVTRFRGQPLCQRGVLTDGAVNHAVQGLQIGKQIRQTAAQGGDAITENMADALKEIIATARRWAKRHSRAESTSRLADAAKNAGVRDGLVIKTYALGT